MISLFTKSLVAGAGVMVLASTALPQQAVEARSVSYELNIPAENLDAALQALALASHHKLLYRAELVSGKTSRALIGTYTTEQAVGHLLEGTQLSFEITPASVVLIKGPDDKVGTGGSVQVPASDDTSTKKETGNKFSQDFRVAQVDQGQTTSGVPVEENEKEKNKKTEGLEEIVVTGTHIRGAAPVGAPVLTLDRTAIEQSGYTTTDQLIQSIPQNFRGGAAGASADASFSSGVFRGDNIAFGSGVNLRGLGATATLVLVNGHRVASSGGGYFTDISTIPLSAIDHIDVLSDGASAIYGSEAIGGVINIVLKTDSQGVETGAHYGIADGGFSTYATNLQVGHIWTGGGFTLGADYSHQDILDASERPFTSSVPSPTSILPAYRQIALSAAGHQQFGERFEIHSDLQYTNKKVSDLYSASPPTQQDSAKVDRWSGSAGGSYRVSNSWILRYDVSGGQEAVDRTVNEPTASGLPPTLFADGRFTSKFSDQTAAAAGDLFALPAGFVKLALGAAYRKEDFREDFTILPTNQTLYRASRSVTSGYGEVRIPIFSEINSAPGFEKLTLSLAGRVDHYSDFGNTTNPKYGISWFPTAELELRGAYSTSFRAPAAGYELVSSQLGTALAIIRSLPGPDGTTRVPVVQLGGGRPGLQPETAKNKTLGFEWKPSFVPDLRISFNYYDISYTNQLAVPPFLTNALSNPALASVVTRYPDGSALEALVNAARANGAFILDITRGAFGSNPLAGGGYVYDLRTQNLSSTDTSGFDVAVQYHFVARADSVDTRIDLTHIDKFTTELTPTSPQISTVNTVGNPARLRLRASAAWTHGPLVVSTAANYVNSYLDTSAITPRDVGSYPTVDLAARYNFSHGIVVSFASINLFNRFPPYVASGAQSFSGSHYDPANANPLGRLSTLQVEKRW